MRSFPIALALMLVACKQDAVPPPVAPKASVAANAETAPAPTQPKSPPTSALSPALPVDQLERMQALGTEPFWSFEVLPDKLIYTSPETEAGIAIEARFSLEGKRMRYTGTMDGKPVILVIERGTCSDGMSDTVYDYTASFTWGDRTEQGCARRK